MTNSQFKSPLSLWLEGFSEHCATSSTIRNCSTEEIDENALSGLRGVVKITHSNREQKLRWSKSP